MYPSLISTTDWVASSWNDRSKSFSTFEASTQSSSGVFTDHDSLGNSLALNGIRNEIVQTIGAIVLIIVILFISYYSVTLDRMDLDVENPSFSDLWRCSSAG